MKVVLDEIINALDCVKDETQMILNTESGETVIWMQYGDFKAFNGSIIRFYFNCKP